MAFLDGVDTSKIKFIAFDLDGTLLDASSKITERTSKALIAAREAGFVPVAATGRPYGSLPDDIFAVPGIKYLITCNGAVIIDVTKIPPEADGTRNCFTPCPDEAVIYRNLMNRQQLEPALDFICNNDFMKEIFFGLKAYTSQKYLDNLEDYGVNVERRRQYIRRTRIGCEDVVKLLYEHIDELENINLSFVNMEDKHYYAKKLQEISDLTIVNSQHFNIEIGSPTTSKANALKALAESMGCGHENIIAFGDSSNDKAMLSAAAIAVGMANGTDELKACAQLIAPANTEDGVAQVIEELIARNKQ